ncbi:MAG: MFS transporter, partial [Exiguobacterium sp.]
MCSALSLSTYLFVEQWYVIHTLNQASFLGFILMATLLPRIFLMLFGGVLSDRYKRSTIMRISSSLRISFILCLLALLHLNQLTLLTILGFAFLFGSVDAFYSPANASLLPTLVPKEQLTKANSLIQTSNQIALFSGPILGGVILSYSSYSHVFLVIFGTLCLTLLFTYGIREAKTRRSLQHSALSELKEGLHYV